MRCGRGSAAQRPHTDSKRDAVAISAQRGSTSVGGASHAVATVLLQQPRRAFQPLKVPQPSQAPTGPHPAPTPLPHVRRARLWRRPGVFPASHGNPCLALLCTQVMCDARNFGSDLEAFQRLMNSVKRGDIVGITGFPGKSKRGELSVFPTHLEVLAPCLHMPPSSHFGLRDQETRYRQRYLDLIANPDIQVGGRVLSCPPFKNFLLRPCWSACLCYCCAAGGGRGNARAATGGWPPCLACLHTTC